MIVVVPASFRSCAYGHRTSFFGWDDVLRSSVAPAVGFLVRFAGGAAASMSTFVGHVTLLALPASPGELTTNVDTEDMVLAVDHQRGFLFRLRLIYFLLCYP